MPPPDPPYKARRPQAHNPQASQIRHNQQYEAQEVRIVSKHTGTKPPDPPFREYVWRLVAQRRIDPTVAMMMVGHVNQTSPETLSPKAPSPPIRPQQPAERRRTAKMKLGSVMLPPALHSRRKH